MLYVFLAGLVIVVVVFILIVKEFVCSFSDMNSINIDLRKYSPKNRYEIRKILSTVKQSKKIIKSSGSIQERIHWLSVILDSLKKLRKYVPYDLIPKVESYEKECQNELKRLESKRHGDDDSKTLPKHKKNNSGSSSHVA